MPDPDDPVRKALRGTEDLYDVATWEVRTVVDTIAAFLYSILDRARSVVLVSIALVLFLSQLASALWLAVQQPTLGVLALVSIAPAFAVAGYFWYGDPTRREPIETLAVTFLLSVLFASFAAVVNTAFFPPFSTFGLAALPIYFLLVVGPIEETVKWLAVRVYAYKTGTFDAVIDGVVYGAVAGLGFATIENFVYILRIFVSDSAGMMGAQVQIAVETATLRAFVGPGHVIYSAFAGYYLGLAKFNPGKRGPIVVKGLLLAVVIHAIYNSVVSLVPLSNLGFVAFVVVFDGILLVVLYRKLRRYRRFYYQALQTGPRR